MIYNMTVAPFNFVKGKGYWKSDGQVTWFVKYKTGYVAWSCEV